MKLTGLLLGGLIMLSSEAAWGGGPVLRAYPMPGEAVPLALAANPEMTVTLPAADYRTFDDLMQAAKAAAHALIDQTFATDPARPAVTVRLVGERAGTLVPLGITSVSPENWRSQPDLDRWSQWFGGSAQALLGFGSGTAQPTLAQNDPTLGTGSDRAPRGRSSRMRRQLPELR